MAVVTDLVWLLLVLGPLLFLQRRLHAEIQAIFLILTRRADLTVALFSVLFFPGVLLHEGSHYLLARLLGVRTGRFSLLPRPMPNGLLQLGFVETARAGWLGDALIGLAPLLVGGAVVAYGGLARLGLLETWQQLQAQPAPALSPVAWKQIAVGILQRPDAWLWLYLTFTISSTMFPSAADRRAWLPVTIVLAGVLGIGLLAGAGPWMAQRIAPAFHQVLWAVSMVFGVSLFLHLLLLLPVWGLRSLLQALRKVVTSQ